jgi:large subunit ribosomal protein L4
MPKGMRRLAIRCVLSAKAGDKELMVLDDLKFDEPRTREMAKVLSALAVEGSVLIAISNPEASLIKSARNLPKVKTIPARLLNVVDITSHKKLLITEAAVHQVEQLWGKEIPHEASNASL